MSVTQAAEFYGPVREVLRSKLKEVVAARSASLLEKEFGFRIPPNEAGKLGEVLGPLFADNQFENIIRFMAGKAPSECDRSQQDAPGSERCIALIYEGVEAVNKIRDVLGPTDPSKAPPGSIRREFGQTIMVNAAHASDSEENAQREMKIVRVDENTFKSTIQSYLATGEV